MRPSASRSPAWAAESTEGNCSPITAATVAGTPVGGADTGSGVERLAPLLHEVVEPLQVVDRGQGDALAGVELDLEVPEARNHVDGEDPVPAVVAAERPVALDPETVGAHHHD